MQLCIIPIDLEVKEVVALPEELRLAAAADLFRDLLLG